MTPGNLSQIYELQKKYLVTLKMLKFGKFSVNKYGKAVTDVSTDRGIEQGNRPPKVVEGIKGIANSNQTLNEYFLTAAEMRSIVASFRETFSIGDHGRKREKHHELSGAKQTTICNNVKKISVVFEFHGQNFESTLRVYNNLRKRGFTIKKSMFSFEFDRMLRDRRSLQVKDQSGTQFTKVALPF